MIADGSTIIEAGGGGGGGGRSIDVFTLPERLLLANATDNWAVSSNKINMGSDTNMPTNSISGYTVYYQGVDGGGLSTVFNVDVTSPPSGSIVTAFQPNFEDFLDITFPGYIGTGGEITVKAITRTIKTAFNPSTVSYATMSGILSSQFGDGTSQRASIGRDFITMNLTYTNTDSMNAEGDLNQVGATWGDIYGIVREIKLSRIKNYTLLTNSFFDMGAYDSSNYARIIRAGYP